MTLFCPTHIAVASFILALIAPVGSSAQALGDNAATPGYVTVRTSRTLFPVAEERASLRQSLSTADVTDRLFSNRTTTFARQAPSQPRNRSVKRKVLVEGDRCNCDDPGLMGALIGAPVGAAIGAILGVKFF